MLGSGSLWEQQHRRHPPPLEASAPRSRSGTTLGSGRRPASAACHCTAAGRGSTGALLPVSITLANRTCIAWNQGTVAAE